MPTVSVIIPNYNHAPYLKQRIDSVLEQTWQDFEVIILDDKSTDNSREIIEQYRNHPKVSHIVYNEENSGSTFKQWKKGIELAKGEWIWIAESDDWCELNFLKTLMEYLIKDSTISLAYCQSYTLLPHNKILVRQQCEPMVKKIPGKEFFTKYLMAGNVVYNTSMVVFNKKTFYKVRSDQYLRYRYCGDWVLWAELSLHGNVLRFSNILNYFRKTGEIDVSTKVIKEGLNFIEDINALNYFYQELNGHYITYIKLMKRYYFAFKDSENYSFETIKKIKQNFIQHIGRKRLLIWDIKYQKQKLAESIFNHLKENI